METIVVVGVKLTVRDPPAECFFAGADYLAHFTRVARKWISV